MEWYTPRYEFRWFGMETSDVAARMAQEGGDPQIKEYRAVYLLSQRGNRIDCRMDAYEIEIRELVNVDDGLEQWKPKVRETFPIPRTSLEDEILPLMGIQMSLRQEEYDMEEVVDKIVPNSPDLIAVHIHGRRSIWTIGDCVAEHSGLLVNGAFIRSLALWGPDRQLILDLHTRLGLQGFENVSYLGALKRITGMVPLVRIPSLPPPEKSATL
jgi:hypothetical protein